MSCIQLMAWLETCKRQAGAGSQNNMLLWIEEEKKEYNFLSVTFTTEI